MVKWLKLKECCEILDSKRIPITAAKRKKGPYPYYGANGVQDYIDDYIFNDELVLLAEDGGNFGSREKPIAYRISGKCWVNNHAHVLKPKKGLNVDYLCYSLAFYNVDKLINGATRKKLTQGAVKDMEIPVVSLATQHKIVSQIKKVQSIKKLRQQQLNKLNKLIKARFVEMFGTIENNIFNYQVVELGKYVSIQGGYAFKSKDFTNSGIRLVQISNVNKDFLEWNNINWLPTSFEQKYKEYLLNENDLVIAMTRPIIKSLNSVKIAKVSKSDLPSLLNQRVGRFIFNKNYVNPIFLEVLCKLQNFKYYIEKMSGNSLQPNVSGKQIEKYKIILPPLPLQNEFADFVQQVDKSKVAVQKSLDETQRLFDSLMQEYFG